ncbi:MAG TPA: YcxB family protein [Bryocella sp.]|nr:YcxB family protein [Bryocella sp.]
MQITYELTQKDFFDSLIAHRNRSAVTRWSLRIILTVVFAFAALGIFLLVIRPSSHVLSNAAPLIGLAVFWGVLLWACPWWAARNQFRKQPSAQGPRTLELDTTGVHWRWDGGTADIEWKNITRFLETKNEFLLYTSPAAFNMVPKRALTPEQVSELRALLSEHVNSSRK